MEQFTYILGAGASANSLPIVKNIPERIKLFSIFINILQKDDVGFPIIEKGQVLDSACILSNPKYSLLYHERISLKERMRELLKSKEADQVISLMSYIDKLASIAEHHASIDTYAKKLFIRGDEEYIQLKAALSFYFLFEQMVCKRETRYDQFFSSIITGTKDNLKLPGNINIINWNYDFQVELSLSEIFDLPDFDSLDRYANVFPSDNEVKEKNQINLVKVNGTAGLFHQKNGRHVFDLDIREIRKQEQPIGDLAEQIVKMTRVFSWYFRARIPDENTTFHFSWEMESDVKHGRDAAKNILRDTNYLIIIGYSFPTFNRLLDSEMLQQLQPQKLRNIYIQAPEKDIPGIRQRLFALNQRIAPTPNGLLSDYQIQDRPETNEFFIPFEFK